MKSCCDDNRAAEIKKINIKKILGGDGVMLFKAKPGYNGVKVEYGGKYYTFYENKTTEAPEILKLHKFLEEVQQEHIEEVPQVKEFKKGGKNADIL